MRNTLRAVIRAAALGLAGVALMLAGAYASAWAGPATFAGMICGVVGINGMIIATLGGGRVFAAIIHHPNP